MEERDQQILESAIRTRVTDPTPDWWPAGITQAFARTLLDQEKRIKTLERRDSIRLPGF